jgi:histidinol-phosphatase
MTSTGQNQPGPDAEQHERAALLDLALQMADAADVITMAHFRSRTLEVLTKPDRTEVTIADRDTEHALIALIGKARPDHGVLGEEHGVQKAEARSRWIIDPIDGTSNYVRGVQVWATLIALETDGRLEVGVVSAPALGTRWWASRGGGAFANGSAIHVSGIARLSEAFLSYSEGPWVAKGWRHAVDELRHRCGRERAFGDFWQHMLVAEGAIDVAAEAIVNLWDLAALQIIVEEAGGVFTDLDGVVHADGGSALSTNGLLHREALALFTDSAAPPR